MPVSSKNRRTFSSASLILLHLLIVLPLAYFLNIWADEASALYTTQKGFITAFQNAATDEKQAPLYFWILSLWRSIDGSIFFARIFSVLCSLAAINLFAGLAQRLFTPRTALLATAFFAFHPFLIWASLEIRVYSLVILLSVLLIRLFFDAFFEEFPAETQRTQRTQRNTRVFFLLVAIVALYTNYYLGFLLVGLFAALLISRRWREAYDYVGLMLVVAAAFFPLLWINFEAQFAANTSGYKEPRSIIEGVRYLWHHFLTFILPAEVFPDTQLSAAEVIRVWAMRIVLLVVGVFAVFRRRYILPTTLSLAALTASIFCCLLFAYFVVGSDYSEIRHASVLFVPLILFAASLLSVVFAADGKRMRIVNQLFAFAGSLLVLASFSYTLVKLYPNMTKRGDWARVGAFIEQNETPGQPIIVFPTFEVLALPYHYHGVNQILPDEKFFAFGQEAAFGSENSLRKEIDFVVSEIPADADMIWLVWSEKCLATAACRPLENYVQANYTIEKEEEFYLEKLYLLRKKP